MPRTAKALTIVLLAARLESAASAQTAPPAAPVAPAPTTAPAPVQPQPYYAPPPAYPGYQPYPMYPQQGYWVPVAAEPMKERSYQPGAPVPRGYHVEERHPRWALITGAVMLGSSYLTGLLFASQNVCNDSSGVGTTTSVSSCHTRWAMVVPVVGPFVDMAQNGRSDRTSTDILIGGGELAGAIFLIIGLATTSPRLIPDYPRAGLSVTPMLASNTTGLSLTLRQ